jgi:alcohol dehydrogenase
MTFGGALRGPREILFGAGQRFALGVATRRLGTRAFVCTDARLSADPTFIDLVDNLHTAGVVNLVYDGTSPELPTACVKEAAERAQRFGPDVVVAVGGGSCLDVAKFVALLLRHGGSVQDYYGEFRVPGPVLPVVAVPTTSGTGSEVTPVAVLGDPERTMKVGVASPFLIPHTAICDPELTVTCPRHLSAIAGADALAHGIESFTALRRPLTSELAQQHVFIGKNDLTDVFSLAAISAIGGHLQRVCDNGGDLVAREQMMFGALTAGLAFGTAGTAAAHAIQYPVGALTGTAHGLGVAVMLPYVMEYNRPYCLSALARVGDLLSVTHEGDEEERRADVAIESVVHLFKNIGIPSTLAELGLQPDKVAWVAEHALSITRLIKNNPRPFTPADMERLVRAAFAGDRASLRTTVASAELQL